MVSFGMPPPSVCFLFFCIWLRWRYNHGVWCPQVTHHWHPRTHLPSMFSLTAELRIWGCLWWLMCAGQGINLFCWGNELPSFHHLWSGSPECPHQLTCNAKRWDLFSSENYIGKTTLRSPHDIRKNLLHIFFLCLATAFYWQSPLV